MAVSKSLLPISPIPINASESTYLFTQRSGIPDSGKGLFTAIKIYRNEIVAVFKGKILTKEKYNALKSSGLDAYFINMTDGTTMDCAGVNCFAKYANDAEGPSRSNKKNNAIITLNDNDEVCLVAIRTINPGSEILCSYGKNYWKRK